MCVVSLAIPELEDCFSAKWECGQLARLQPSRLTHARVHCNSTLLPVPPVPFAEKPLSLRFQVEPLSYI